MMKKILLLILSILFVNISFAQEQKVSFLFAGDAMQHKAQIDAARTKDGYDYSSYFRLVAGQIKAADIAVVNLEVTLAGKPYTGYPCFGAPDEYAFALRDAGFDIFLTANNHILDRKRKGLERTLTMLDSMKVKYTGVFADEEKRDLFYPLMMIKNGVRIAMLNYTYGTNDFVVTPPNIVNYIDKKQILEDIASAQQMKANIIIANMHWGDEYRLKPNKEQIELADFLVENGVRLVIGNHPHVVQPIDVRKEGDEIKSVIVYSLGNLISAMKPVNTTGGFMVNIDISKDDNNAVKIDSCSYSLVWVNKLMKGDIPYSFELIPVSRYDNEEGREMLGEAAFEKMQSFATTAREVADSMNRD